MAVFDQFKKSVVIFNAAILMILSLLVAVGGTYALIQCWSSLSVDCRINLIIFAIATPGKMFAMFFNQFLCRLKIFTFIAKDIFLNCEQ